jgi:hypothetical protein
MSKPMNPCGKDTPMNKDWHNGRPADWHGIPVNCGYCDVMPKDCHICKTGFEAGATAMLEAVVKKVDETFIRKPVCWGESYCDDSCDCEYFRWQSFKKEKAHDR